MAGTLLFGTGYGSIYTFLPPVVGGSLWPGNFGFIWGMLFNAMGVAGGLGPLAAAALADLCGNYNPAFLAGLATALVTFFTEFSFAALYQASAHLQVSQTRAFREPYIKWRERN